ncbi:MAG: peptidoglycan editing factor PgeF [Pseudomonadota bacterium]
MPETSPQPLQSDLLAGAYKVCRHGFFTRHGGVSNSPWDSLNVGWRSGDDQGNVAENRARIAGWFDVGSERLASLRQVHSARAVAIHEPQTTADVPEADGLVTDLPGIWLGVLGADCAPVLLIDPEVPVIGALHAGWPGALAGIVEATALEMERLGAQRRRILAAVGPTIAQRSYEVGADFQSRFIEQYPDSMRRFRTFESGGKPHFDLPGFVQDCLAAAGVGAIDDLARDTRAESDLFFSRRHAVQEGDGRYGLQMSVIGMP